MSDFLLMEKYTVSTKGLQGLFQKLVDAGLISKSGLSKRNPRGEDSVQLDIIKCPSCGMPQFGSFDECPQCGVILSKYQQKCSIGASSDPNGSSAHPAGSALSGQVFHSKVAMFRSDPQRTEFYNSRGVHKLTTLEWKYKAEGWVASSPAVSEGVAYVGSYDGSMYALLTSTGKVHWRLGTKGPVRSSPALTQGRLFFGSLDGNFYAINKNHIAARIGSKYLIRSRSFLAH